MALEVNLVTEVAKAAIVAKDAKVAIVAKAAIVSKDANDTIAASARV